MAVNVKGGALEFDAVINMGDFEAQISRLQKQLEALTNASEKEAGAIDNLVKKTAAAIATYASFTAATNFVRDIVTVRGEFQQLEVAFTTMLGSKEKADKLMAEVTQFAATTPFELKEVAGATRQLLAFGISADKIKDTLRALGDVSAGVGAPIQEIATIYGKARVQGRLFAEDINQLTGRGIPIIQELAKQFGVADDEVKKLVESGKVGFPQIEQAFKDLTSTGSIFGGLMAEQAKTLTGQISNLQDAWARMLNDIGKSNEGVFSNAIQAAISLVENYETVLDVLKVLVITYGSYKAAVITATAVQAIATSVTKGYTIAETLRFQAMVLSEKAMKLLNVTMLSNPAVAVATGVAALIATFVIFRKETNNVKSATELLADAQKKATDSYAQQEAKLRPFLEILKQGNLSEQQRVDIYKKLQQIDPKIVQGIDAKSLSYENLRKNVDAYLNSLRNQLAIEANQDAITASIKQEQEIENRIKKAQDRIKKLNDELKSARDSESRGLTQFSIKEQETDIQALKDQLELQKQVTTELGKQGAEQAKTSSDQQAAHRRTVEVIEDEIKALKDQRDKVSATSAEYKKFTDQITKLEKELEAITGKDAAKKALKDAKDRNKELKDLLKDIDKAEEQANRTGLTKEETEVDRINARYDELKKRALEVKAGQGVLQRIENARATEVGNETLRDRAEEYKKFIKDQQDAFAQFEDYKVEVGEKKARELTAFQTAEYTDVIEFLKVQLALVSRDLSVGGKLKKDLLVEAIATAEKDKVKRETDKQIETIKRVITESQTAAQTRLKIEAQYEKDVQVLKKNFSGKELEDRTKVLKAAKDEDLKQLAGSLAEQGKAYRALNQDIVRFTKDRIDQEIDNLKKLLDDPNIDANTRKAIEAAIEQWKNVRKEIDDTNLDRLIEDADKFSKKAFEIASIFIDLGSAFEGINDGLADTLNTIGEIANIAGDAAAGIAQIASGQFVQGIGSVVKAIAGVFAIGKKARESERQARQEVEAFQSTLLQGETEITLLYRERSREQAKLNKLKLDGLRDEKKLLEEQKKLNEQQFQQVLKQLQAESAIVGKTTEKYGGFLGIGKKTRSVDIVESLAGKSFDELEQLFLKGQLEGKAKELFELLQKIKQEGVDIDSLLGENAEAAKQAFTGTTADSITDSIIDGFKNGLRSARDFADNFEDLMRNAVLQSIKLQALEGPLNDFFDEFAAASQSDNLLTQAEIDQLNSQFNSIIDNAGKKFEELQKITNLDFSSTGAGGSGNSLTSAIRGITEQQADLLAGQFGGLRLTALDHLKVAQTSLSTLQTIQGHTANLVTMYQLWQRIELNGIKIK